MEYSRALPGRETKLTRFNTRGLSAGTSLIRIYLYTYLSAKIGYNNFEEYRYRNLCYSESKAAEVLLSLDR